MTLMHDRHLASVTTPLSMAEAFHWYQSVAQFNAKLSGTVKSSDRDPLWATSMCLGILSFFYVEAQTPEEVWPLRSPSDTDLGWLDIWHGKTDIWKAAGLSTMESIFDKPYQNLTSSLAAPEAGLKNLPNDLVTICRLDILSMDDGNSYRSVAISLAQILHADSALPVIFGFLSVVGNLKSDFKQLLHDKDPVALLLLAYWYAKLCQYPHWWLSRRAWLEGQSICVYLDKYCQLESMQSLLQFPVAVFGTFMG
jgi:hypothetical protein